jgi:hypothetical protein
MGLLIRGIERPRAGVEPYWHGGSLICTIVCINLQRRGGGDCWERESKLVSNHAVFYCDFFITCTRYVYASLVQQRSSTPNSGPCSGPCRVNKSPGFINNSALPQKSLSVFGPAVGVSCRYFSVGSPSDMIKPELNAAETSEYPLFTALREAVSISRSTMVNTLMKLLSLLPVSLFCNSADER